MKISEEKKKKISEQILALLYEHSVQSLFTAQIAKDLARDEEFTKAILNDLEKKGLIIKISKNPKGFNYLRRQRWRLDSKIYDYYFKQQNNLNHFSLE